MEKNNKKSSRSEEVYQALLDLMIKPSGKREKR